MKIQSLNFVSSFDIDREITLTCGKDLKILEKELKGKLLLPSIPDSAPPEAPRALLQCNDSILVVGWNRFELNITPPNHINTSYAGCLEFIKNRSVKTVKRLMELVTGYEWSGLVVKCHYPFENKDQDNILPLFDKLLNVQRKERSLSAFRLQFGYKEGDFNKNYNLTRYETRNVNISIPPNSKGLVKLDLNKSPIIDAGLEINIDINNITGNASKDWDSDLINLIGQHVTTFSNLPQELNLEGIIK
jgi:hypothetical protein